MHCKLQLHFSVVDKADGSSRTRMYINTFERWIKEAAKKGHQLRIVSVEYRTYTRIVSTWELLLTIL